MANLNNLCFILLALLCPLLLRAQTPELTGILERLDRLERENRTLAEEVRALRAELAASRDRAELRNDSEPRPEGTPAAEGEAPTATLEQRLEIQEHRIEEQAQTKVEASQKFPIRLTGLALFNSFLNSGHNGRADDPTFATLARGPRDGGATMRQTIIGLEYRGPETIWGGRVHGSVFMDFYNGVYSGSGYLAEWARLRTGSIEIDWNHRSVMVGVEKPIFNPREPSSLAQVGVSPLTGAGNLWLWLPQARVEQDLSFGPASGLRARLGVVETHETTPYGAPNFAGRVEPARPGAEGRFEFFHNLDDQRRLEIAAGFHASTTHAGGFSAPSSLLSVDWFFNPSSRLEFTGAFFTGQNVSHLGTGGINQGYIVYAHRAQAIAATGGWGQVTFHAASHLDFHFFSGQQNGDNSLFSTGDIGKNLAIGGNLFFHLAPNVVLAPEFLQLRTLYIGHGTATNNHYDLALGYFF